MSIIASPLRAFWIPGLNAVSGRVLKGLAGWILDEEYQIYSPLQPDAFTLNVPSPDGVLAALAADINRCSMASFESANSVVKNDVLPRSTAWLVIKTYYAAFFSAHAISRMLGTAFLQLEKPHGNSVTRIANLFGMLNGQQVSKGYYECNFDSVRNELVCRRIKPQVGGVHEVFWSTFSGLVRNLSYNVISSGSAVVANNQQASAKLTELADNLGRGSFGKGNWLSIIRNNVNYAQRFGTWFPYSEARAYSPRLFEHKNDWLADPMNVDLASHSDRDLLRFQASCNFLVALCRVLVSDMAIRNPGKKSFHNYGGIALLNLMGLGKHLATS